MEANLPMLTEPLTVSEALRKTAILDPMLVIQNILLYCRKFGYSYLYFISHLTHLVSPWPEIGKGEHAYLMTESFFEQRQVTSPPIYN